MSSSIQQRADQLTARVKDKTKVSGWKLPQESTTFADPHSWSNIDSDVTPQHRRTWTSWTILGFWLSDALNAQGWQSPASIIAIGLTWREALYCIVLGMSIDSVPLVLNGAIGAHLHVPFPVAARASFGFYFSRFAIIVRMTTALFWHAIQTYTGSTAITQCIRAIFPSYLDIPNHIPDYMGVTTQQLISHLLFWSIQFPFMLVQPHKLKWFFWMKAVVVITTSVATVIAMTKMAGGTGDIWDQDYRVSGSQRSWLIMASMMSQAGGWATMATNVPDFTRYLRDDRFRSIYWQALFLPLISLLLGLCGIIATSASKVVYGEYIWDPLALAARWDGPAGRCGAFFVGFSWCVAQIGTNLSANVISASNDLVGLLPRWFNLRRGAIVITVTAGWIMQPWKIVHSAQSLLTFMAGLAIFLAPIAAILATDYWAVKRRCIDVPSLYRRHARYQYFHGWNWRAAAAFLISVTPNVPGLAQAVNPNMNISEGGQHMYNLNYLYGFLSASFSYWLFSYLFPATETLLDACIYDDTSITIDGIPADPVVEDKTVEEKQTKRAGSDDVSDV